MGVFPSAPALVGWVMDALMVELDWNHHHNCNYQMPGFKITRQADWLVIMWSSQYWGDTLIIRWWEWGVRCVEADNTSVLTSQKISLKSQHLTGTKPQHDIPVREREIFIPEQSAQIESWAETKNHLEREEASWRRAISLDQNCQSRPQ